MRFKHQKRSGAMLGEKIYAVFFGYHIRGDDVLSFLCATPGSFSLWS